jgi:hypothetical protein
MLSVSGLYRQHSHVFNKKNSRVEAIYNFQGRTATYSKAETAYNFQHGSGHSRAAESMEADTQEHWHFGSSMTLQLKRLSFLTLFYLAQIFHSNLITFSRSKEAFTQGD